MKNRKIAEVLKAYRKMNNLSVRDVTELLEEKSLKVAEKTVYGIICMIIPVKWKNTSRDLLYQGLMDEMIRSNLSMV